MKTKPSFRLLRIVVATVFMAAMLFAFSGFSRLESLSHIQFGPALLKLLVVFSAGTLSTVVVIVVVTFLFGRFYCAVLCPFGILQDFIGFLSRRKAKDVPNYAKTRYAIAGVSCGMLFFGFSVVFLLLDPYSNFGRIVGTFSVGSVAPLIVISTLAIWKKRIYCTTVCPVGTLLGIFAKYGVFKLRLDENCVNCGRCGKMCPSGCIDSKAGTLDNERCVRCMNCVSICRLHAVRFSLYEQKVVPINKTRRTFLLNGGVLIAGFAVGVALAKTGVPKLVGLGRRFKILPPGAGDIQRFASKCTACQLCTVNCPTKIIAPAKNGIGPVSLDLSKGACRYDCNRCTQVCPTGAIRPLTLETKQRTRIAEAKLNPRTCIVFQEDEKCGKCAEVCPTGAVTLRKTGAPRMNVELCIGCGACQMVCSAPKLAMTMHEIEKQTFLES